MWEYLEKVTDKLGEAITGILEYAGDIVGHIYTVFVRQEIITGGIGVMTGIVFVIGAIVAFIFGRKIYNSKLEVWDKTALIVAITLVGASLLNSGATYLTEWTPHLLNPEYHALQNAMNMLRNIK